MGRHDLKETERRELCKAALSWLVETGGDPSKIRKKKEKIKRHLLELKEEIERMHEREFLADIEKSRSVSGIASKSAALKAAEASLRRLDEIEKRALRFIEIARSPCLDWEDEYFLKKECKGFVKRASNILRVDLAKKPKCKP